jgi:hypothetical protein
MPPTIVGPLSKTLDRLEFLIASSPTFQTWVGAIDVPTARDSVFIVQEAGSPALPYALISQGDVWRLRRTQQGDGTTEPHTTDGSLSLTFKGPYTGDNDTEAEFYFGDVVAEVLKDMMRLSADSITYLPVLEISAESPPQAIHPHEETSVPKYVAADYRVAFINLID